MSTPKMSTRKMSIPEMSTVPKYLLPKCLLCQKMDGCREEWMDGWIERKIDR